MEIDKNKLIGMLLLMQAKTHALDTVLGLVLSQALEPAAARAVLKQAKHLANTSRDLDHVQAESLQRLCAKYEADLNQ